MGAGASLGNDAVLGEDFDGSLKRYYCHECHQITRSSEVSSQCGACHSAFIEEMESPPPGAMVARREGGGGEGRGDMNLSQDQSRRLANAALMLRLLERQLQNELESIQSAYNQAQAEQESTQCMSPVMKRKLRRPVADVDMICSQPSCPICSEDFAVGNEVLQLPCTHIYHETCVVPWLDMKKTCPICRYLLTNDIPSVTDLEKFPRDELARLLATEKKEYAEEERARAKKRAMNDDTDDTAAVPLKKDEEEEDKEGEGEGGGREFVNKTKLAHDIVETMSKRRAAQDKDIGIMNSDRMRALRERQQQPQREEGYRTESERVQNPSPSNRTLREVIEEAERERERQNRDRRDRMRALGILPAAESIGTALGGGVAGSLPAMRSPALAAPGAVVGMGGGGGGGQQDDFSRMLSAILHSSNMGLQSLSDSDNEEGEGEGGSDVRTEREVQRRAGGATGTPGGDSGIVDDRAVSEAQANLLHARTALASAREENTRLEGTGLMPTTFVIRSNGSDSMQIERRQALREAIDAID